MRLSDKKLKILNQKNVNCKILQFLINKTMESDPH
jgi:hypothetical protein